MSVDVEQQMLDLQKRISKLENRNNDQLSMVVFSGDMDKILAAMIIATGATAMDSKVKMFFTFWAIASLRDAKKKAKGKDFMFKMLGMMLPRGRNKLKLSNMNMGGMGPAMIKSLMKKQNLTSLDQLFAAAAELGVEICICEMSMNLMGFKKEEMIDYPHLSYCGVGTFLSDADESSVQLFI